MQLVRFFLLALLAIATVHGAAPSVEALFPIGAPRGSTNIITLSGKFDPWPPNVWISGPQRRTTGSRPGPTAAAADLTTIIDTNKGKLKIIVDADAEPGPRIFRLFNDEGASDPRLFVVGAGPEIMEVETNDHFMHPQVIDALPMTIDGRLAKGGDVDSFAVHLKAGELLEARVDSYTLMSKLDAVLRLVTTNGQQLAWNHDFATLDPRVAWRAEAEQQVVVQVFGFPYPATAQIRLHGGDSAFYRLHVRPMAMGETPSHDEPVGSTDQAAQLSLPATMHGCINSGADEDRFKFTLAKDQIIEARVSAAAVGSPLDAWLAVYDADSKELARSDDAEDSRDPVLEWKAPSAGSYYLAVGSVTHRGSDQHQYELDVRRVGPDFRASLSTGSLVLNTGSTNTLKFKIKRLRGHTNELTAALAGLPQGVTSVSTNLAGKGGDFELPLVAEADAAPFSGPIHLYVTDETTREHRLVPLPLTSRTEDNGVPGGYTELLLEEVDHCWLTVRKKPDTTPKTAAK